jgi:O-acetyl-ADP-ribose deacetylase
MMVVLKELRIAETVVRVVQGDLTEAPVDAIVNAANSYLQHGGGVAGAIVRKGGSIIQEESNLLGYLPVGQAKITGAGKLPAKYVIHTVGPRWGEGDEERKLESAIRNTLHLADEKAFATIAMPAISAGIFGFPKARCAHIILSEIVAFLQGGSRSLKGIDIYLLDQEMIRFFETELDKIGRGL